MSEYSIIGAGISGLSAGYHLSLKNMSHIVYEKRDRWGGLCDNFEIDKFRFDYCIHLSFTENDYVKQLFSESTEFGAHIPNPYNYYNHLWLKHPAQNNLFNLPIDQKVEIIRDMISNRFASIKSPKNYYEWLLKQYGGFFTNEFPAKYTKKYWTVDAEHLSTSWVGNRMYKPNLDEILTGAMKEDTPVTYYAKEMRYPKSGGYKSFLNKMREKTNINFNKTIVEIDIINKKLMFQDDSFDYYENLISSLPLPEIIKMIKGVPQAVKDAAEKLVASEVDLVSIGFNQPDIAKYLWFYIYDDDILPSRAYSPNLKSLENVPNGCSSLQFETYSSKYNPLKINGDNLIQHIIQKGEKMGLFSKNDIQITNYKKIKYGNVIFNHNMVSNRNIVHKYLNTVGVKNIGRFGEWDYLWSDQSLLSGKKIADYV